MNARLAMWTMAGCVALAVAAPLPGCSADDATGSCSDESCRTRCQALGYPTGGRCSAGNCVCGEGGDGGGDGSGCTSAAPFCSSDGRNVLRCNSSGTAEVLQACWPDLACRLGACVTAVCSPGQSECVDSDTQRRCASDGSGWEETDCATGMRCGSSSGMCGAPCLMRMFILLDQSGSMADGAPSKWEQARQALSTLTASPAAADMEFGLGAFPTDGNCGVDGLVAHPVPEADAAMVGSYFSSHSANGATPLLAAMQAMAEDTSANLSDEAYHNALLVVSDGMDTCYDDCVTGCFTSPTPFVCITECEARVEAEVAGLLAETTARLRDERQIRTYVIGFGSDVSDLELSAIAENGGTALARWIAAGNVDDLTAALQTIIDEMWECNPILR
ncbi:MAG: hypothetical protein HY907_17385 [Deltaproteobacteria bacterium]|nr:hypothetical protein [Deltaproteobacteria bacterium]